MSTEEPEGRPEPALSDGASDDIHTVARGGGVQIAGQLSQRGLSFLFAMVATRVLGEGGYGLYRTIAQTLAVGAQLGLAGFNFATMRFIARARAVKDHGGVRGSVRIGSFGALLASTAMLVVVVVFAEFFAELYVDERVETVAYYLRIGAPYIPLFALMQVLRYSTQAYKTMVPSVTAGNIVQPAVRFILGTALVIPFGITGAVTGLTVSLGVGALAAGWYLTRMMTPQEKATPPSTRVGPMVRFALPQTVASLLSVQELGYGILILNALSTNRAAGLFALGLMLQGPGTVFLGGIVNIWAPVVTDLHSRGEIDRLRSLYQTINRWTATFSFPVFGALIFEGDMFMDVFFNATGPNAHWVAAILAAGNFFYTGTGPTGYVISMTGHPGVNAVNSVLAMAMYFGLGVWAVPRFGVLGMAVVDAVVTAVVNLVRVVEAQLLVGVQPFGRTFVKPVAATLAGAAVLGAWQFIPGDTVALEVGGLVLGAGTYVLVLRKLGLDPEERLVIDRVRRRFSKARGGRRSEDGG